MATDERPSRKLVKKSDSPLAGAKERLRNALITGTAGGYLGGMLIEGKARVKVPAFTRRLLRMKRKTIGVHGARTGAAIGAAVGAGNRGKRSETVDSVATGGDWKFSAYIEDMTFGELPKDVQKDIQRFVTAEKGTPVVHYGMTVKELLGKADPDNLKTARKALGTLRASRAAEEVLGKIKDGSKYILLINDRIVDGHHFLAKAERGGVTSSLNVLDLTPARLTTRFSAAEMGQFLLTQFEEKKKSGWKRKAAIAAGTAAGAVLGARTLPRLIRRGRPLKDGEELAGKVLYTHEGLTTPASVVNIGGKTVRRRLEKKALKGSKLAGAALKVDDFLGIPQRHYGIGAGGGRVIEKTKAHGHRMVGKEGFARGNRVHVDSDTLPKDSSKWGEWAKGMEKRNEAAQSKARRGDLCLIGNNCEHHARDIAGQGRKSYQSRAIVGGAAGGAVAGGAVVGAMTKRKREEKQMGVNAMLLHLFEEARERRNRVREARDKIGLAKDVAGLGLVTGAGVGGVKIYKIAKKGIQQAAPKVGAAARAWHKAALKTGKTLDKVTDAVEPVAATNRGIKAVGSKIGSIARKAMMWMHGDPRPVHAFARRKQPPVVVQPPPRDNWQKARDGALIAGGAATVGAAGYTAHKAGKAIAGLAKRGRAALRQVPQVTDNVQNATSISADMGRVYRKARKVVTDSVDAFKGGLRDAAGKPAPSWARRTVKIGKKLRLLESQVPSFKFQVSSSRARMNEFILGTLGTIAGTLAGTAAGAKFRYPVQNYLKKKLVPKLGKTWGKRVARAGSFAPENAGALAGGAAGSLLTGGMRKKREEEEFNALLVQALHQFGRVSQTESVAGHMLRLKKRGVPLVRPWMKQSFPQDKRFPVRSDGPRPAKVQMQAHQFGGNEQLADLDNGRFPDPFKKWLKGEKAYRKIDVTDYHRLRRRLLGRDLKPEQVNKIKSAMADIKDNKAVDIAGGQVLHSALRKADTVRKVAERGSGLVRDAVKAAKGEGREKDRWGREKKREWEKPWFQRRRNQLIATGGLLAAGYLGRHTKVGARAVRKGEEMIHKGRAWANKKLTNVFPDEGTEAARAAHNAKVTGKPQSTPADILKETEEMAKATRKKAAQLDKAKKKVEAQGPELKLVPEPKPAAQSPAPAAVKSQKSEVSGEKPPVKPAAAPKPAGKSARAPVQAQAPAAKSGSAWGASRLANEPPKPTAAEAAVKAASKPKQPKKPKPGVAAPKKPTYNGLTGKWEMNRLLGWALTQFADPLDVGWDIRDARGNSARVFAPHAGQRDRRPKRWHERVENERKLWAGAALTGTLAGGAAMRKLLGKQTKQTVDREVKRRVAQIGAAVKKRYTVKRAAGSGGGKAPNVVPMFTPKEAA